MAKPRVHLTEEQLRRAWEAHQRGIGWRKLARKLGCGNSRLQLECETWAANQALSEPALLITKFINDKVGVDDAS